MESTHQVMRFSIEDGKLKAEIDIADLVSLFHTDPENCFKGYNVPYAVVKPGKEEKLAEELVKYLFDDDLSWNVPRWAKPVREVFMDWIDGYASEFVSYYEDGEVTPEQLARWKKDNGQV